MPQLTLGYQRIGNWVFNTAGGDEFGATFLVGQPEPPRCFATVVGLNRRGPPLLGDRR